jgi:hypothetical protein
MVTNPKLKVRNLQSEAMNHDQGHTRAASEISPSRASQSNPSAKSPVHEPRHMVHDPMLPAPPLTAPLTTNRNSQTTLSSTHPSPMIDEMAITATGYRYWLLATGCLSVLCFSRSLAPCFSAPLLPVLPFPRSLFFSLPCSLLLRSLAPCFTVPSVPVFLAPLLPVLPTPPCPKTPPPPSIQTPPRMPFCETVKL